MLDFVKLSFPNANIQPLRVADLHFHQERGKHEFATIRIRDWNFSYESLRPGTPAHFKLKGESALKEFYGYIHHVTPHVSPGNNWLEIHLIGASYHLKQASQQIYKNVTATDVVKKIAKRVGFAFNIVDHPRFYKQIAQAGLTDLEMLQKLAKQCGYSLRIQNAEIHFLPVTKIFDEVKQAAKVFTLKDANRGGTTIYSFTPHIGESLEQDGEHKAAARVSGVDITSVGTIQRTNPKRPQASKQKTEAEYFDRFDTHVVVNDHDVAKHEASAADERIRFPYRATAEVIGTPDLHPDAPVYLDGIGQEYGGYWTVLSVEHRVIQKNVTEHVYTSILHLGTDSLGKDVPRNGSPAVGKPPALPKRIIIPGVRQTNKKPVTKLQTGSRNPAPKKTPVGFGTVNNRTRPKVANKTIVANKWSSPSGSLRTVQKRTTPSPAVVNQLRSLGVRA